MTYNRFSAYFRKEINAKTNVQSPKKETESGANQPNESEPNNSSKAEPLILRAGERKRVVYNPHTREIDPKDIL